MTIPEIHDEVLVTFIYGNINNAIVVGALYNGIDTPPYANEDGENNLRVFQSRSGHRVTFDDTADGERIELVTHNESIRGHGCCERDPQRLRRQGHRDRGWQSPRHPNGDVHAECGQRH